MHFGRGLVATQEDFGSQGACRRIPKLLDWLAARFIDSGWDVKALHRLIVSSRGVPRSRRTRRADLLARDPDNLLLARGPKTRLLAEEIRDSALAASGLLIAHASAARASSRTSPRVCGSRPAPARPTPRTAAPRSIAAASTRSGSGRCRRRRWPRSTRVARGLHREARRTATPLQALVLLNDPQFVEAARVLAERLLQRGSAGRDIVSTPPLAIAKRSGG